MEGIHVIASQVNACEITVGLLLLSVSAACALVEERDRGSLDVILTTPLPTCSIVLGKWWGTFALVPRLMIFPVWVACAFALISDRWVGALWMTALTLAYAAAITSLGLAIGTWVRQPGRAIAAGVLAYVVMTVGWPAAMGGVNALLGPWNQTWDKLLLGSPFYAVKLTTEHAGRFGHGAYGWYGWGEWNNWLANEPWWPLGWIFVYGSAAALLVVATLATFDRCLGRATGEKQHP